MKTIASHVISLLFILQAGALRATSWETQSFEEIVDGSDLIGIFSDISFSDEPSDESEFFLISAAATELMIKGRVNQKITFCAKHTEDFSEEFDSYLLFLYSPVVDEGLGEKSMGCDYFLRTSEQNAYPVVDYCPESRSGRVIIFRSSGFDGEVKEYELHSTPQDMFISVELSSIVDAISEVENF